MKQDVATQIELAINENKYQQRAASLTPVESKALDKAERAFEEMNLFKE